MTIDKTLMLSSKGILHYYSKSTVMGGFKLFQRFIMHTMWEIV